MQHYCWMLASFVKAIETCLLEKKWQLNQMRSLSKISLSIAYKWLVTLHDESLCLNYKTCM